MPKRVNGKTITSFDIDNEVDDIFYDGNLKQIYLSCGGGYINVFKLADANTYTSNGKISTHSGARTFLFISQSKQLIVASPSSFSSDASLLIDSIK